MYLQCILAVPKLYLHCTLAVIKLNLDCTLAVPCLYLCCTLTVPCLYLGCTPLQALQGLTSPACWPRLPLTWGELELSLRNSLLSRMVCQGRQVVYQTVRTTRLSVPYFRRQGYRTFQELMRENAQQDALELQLVQEGAAMA